MTACRSGTLNADIKIKSQYYQYYTIKSKVIHTSTSYNTNAKYLLLNGLCFTKFEDYKFCRKNHQNFLLSVAYKLSPTWNRNSIGKICLSIRTFSRKFSQLILVGVVANMGKYINSNINCWQISYLQEVQGAKDRSSS